MIATVALLQTTDAAPENSSGRLRPLHDLDVGCEAVIDHLNLAEEDRNRLEIMGICPGRKISMTRRGDPLIVRVHETHLGLARELAHCVMVDSLPRT